MSWSWENEASVSLNSECDINDIKGYKENLNIRFNNDLRYVVSWANIALQLTEGPPASTKFLQLKYSEAKTQEKGKCYKKDFSEHVACSGAKFNHSIEERKM